METNEYSRYISRTAFSEMKGSAFDESDFYSSGRWSDDFEYIGDFGSDESGGEPDEKSPQSSAEEDGDDAAEKRGKSGRSLKKKR